MVAQDLLARGAKQVEIAVADASDYSRPGNLIFHDAVAKIGEVDMVLFAQGALGNQRECEQMPERAAEIISINFTSSVWQLTYIANYFEARKRGTIAVISSVAGDRGRASNYVYGAAKAGLSAFVQGLRNRLCKSGVRVIDIRPGFVSTPMTSGMHQGPLFAEAAQVGEGIFAAMTGRGDIVYLPKFWRWIMLVVKLIPESVFKRLNL